MDDVEIWRVRRILRYLRDARGSGTSMVSLIVPPRDQLLRVNRLLQDEASTATNIKSRVNRASVLTAIQAAQSKLRTLKAVPKNGLGIFAGTIITKDCEKLICECVEPPRVVQTSLYLCDQRFHVDALLSLCENASTFGFVIVDGHECLIGTLQGALKEIKQRFTVDLPKKHGRGGQSSVRFARLRVEKRLIYAKKASEACTKAFITDALPNIAGLFLAGSADLKNELLGYLDYRLKAIVLKTIDTNYGGEAGFSEAVSLASECLQGLEFAREANILKKLFTEVRENSGQYAIGIKQTLKCLEEAQISDLIIWENLDHTYNDQSLVDYLAENHNSLSINLHIIAGTTEEGHQLVTAFEGIGAILRYKIDTNNDDLDYEDIPDDEIF